MKSIRGDLVRTGVFVAVTAAATGLLAVTIGNIDFQPTAGYSAVFTDAVNVNPGDEVRLAGVRVGSVTGVSLVDGNEAKVSFGVDTSVPVTRSTDVVIRYRNLIGQRYLALVDTPGDPSRLPPGSTIPVERTQPALNLTTLFNGFRPLLSGLEPTEVNQLSYELIQVLQGEGGTVDTLFSQVGSLTGTLATHDALIGDVIDNLNGVLGPLDTHSRQLSALLGNLQRFVSGLSQDRQAIGASLAGIDQLTGVTAGLLQQARQPLAHDIAQLGSLAEQLDQPASQALLTHFLTYTPFKLQVATPEASYAAFLNFYVCAADFIPPNGSPQKPQTWTPFYINSAKRCHA